jgi:flavin reductase
MPDPTAFRAAMAAFPTGVTLITYGPPETVEVMTANSFVSISLEPLLILVSIGRGGRMCQCLAPGQPFAVQVLSADQHELAARFARRDRPAGAEAARWLGAAASPSGNTLVPGVVASFECEVQYEYPGGDHLLYVGRVLNLDTATDPATPLLFHRGEFTAPRDTAVPLSSAALS